MAEDESPYFAKVEEATETLKRAMAELGAVAADDSAPREVRLKAALGLAQIRDQLRRMIPATVEALVRIAYGDPHPDPTDPVPPDVRANAARELVERGLATRAELHTLSMEVLIARTHERLARQGIVDDTGLVG